LTRFLWNTIFGKDIDKEIVCTMKPFPTLTVRGQARRLRKLAINALASYDLDVAHFRLITNDVNGIFRIDTTDGRKFILRVTAPEGGHILDHVTAEMDWLAALARDTDLSVPRPLRTRDGSLVVTASADGVPEPRMCEIFSWVDGKNLVEDMSEVNLAKLGELSAKLHAHALTYHPPTELSLLRFDRVFPFSEAVVLFEEHFSNLFTPERRTIYQKGIDWAQESIDRLKASGEPMRILHGDLHQWNIRNARGVLSPIDFEDVMLGWPVQDIATTLYYFLRDDYLILRSAFQTGYTRHSPWPERYPGEINSFIAARGIGLANLVLNDPNISSRIDPAEFVERIEKRLRRLIA
jgi:Ser/Thr protein kinase RdoA (MazF antagonist)